MNGNQRSGRAGVVRRMPSELSLWCAALQGTIRHRRRRREVVVRRRDTVVAGRAAERQAARHRRSAGRPRTVAMMSGLVLGSTVPAWALVATINTPQVYSEFPSGPPVQAEDPGPGPTQYIVPSSETPSAQGPATRVLAAGRVSALTHSGVAATSAPGVAVPSAQSTWYAWETQSDTSPADGAGGTGGSAGGQATTDPTGQPSGASSQTGAPPSDPAPTETGSSTSPPVTETPSDPAPSDTPSDPAPSTSSTAASSGTPSDATPTRTYEAGQPGRPSGSSTQSGTGFLTP